MRSLEVDMSPSGTPLEPFNVPSDNNQSYEEPEIERSDYEEEPEEEIEVEVDSSEGSDEEYEEPIEAQKPEVKQRSAADERIGSLLREKYRKEHERKVAEEHARSLSEENEMLRRNLANADSAAMKYYDDTVSLRLEKAKKLKAEAYETGDVDSIINADIELADAVQELKEIRKWETQQKIQLERNKIEQERTQKYQPRQQEISPIAEQWVDENPWFVPGSSEYSPELADAAARYADQLDAHLYQTGQAHHIRNSEEYFNMINQHLYDMQNQPQQQVQPQRKLAMKSSRSPVAPVRTAASQQGVRTVNGKTTVKLSPAEKETARYCGVSEEAYARSLVKDMQENPEKRKGVR